MVEKAFWCHIILSICHFINKQNVFSMRSKGKCKWGEYGVKAKAGNTKGGSITVPLTSCLTGLESAV